MASETARRSVRPGVLADSLLDLWDQDGPALGAERLQSRASDTLVGVGSEELQQPFAAFALLARLVATQRVLAAQELRHGQQNLHILGVRALQHGRLGRLRRAFAQHHDPAGLSLSIGRGAQLAHQLLSGFGIPGPVKEQQDTVPLLGPEAPNQPRERSADGLERHPFLLEGDQGLLAHRAGPLRAELRREILANQAAGLRGLQAQSEDPHVLGPAPLIDLGVALRHRRELLRPGAVDQGTHRFVPDVLGRVGLEPEQRGAVGALLGAAHDLDRIAQAGGLTAAQPLLVQERQQRPLDLRVLFPCQQLLALVPGRVGGVAEELAYDALDPLGARERVGLALRWRGLAQARRLDAGVGHHILTAAR
jgi:hypothetical protein